MKKQIISYYCKKLASKLGRGSIDKFQGKLKIFHFGGTISF